MDRPALNHAGLFDASPNAYLVLDRDLNIAGANRAYLRSVKRELADIVGRWAWEAFPTDPDTERRAVASFQKVIRTRKPDTMAFLRFDVPRPESEGGGMEERYWTLVHSPVLDAAGEVELIIQSATDVTELRNLRDAAGEADQSRLAAHGRLMRRAEDVADLNRGLEREIATRTGERDLLATIVQSTDAAIMALGADYRILALNDANKRELARIFGIRAGPGDDLLALLADKPAQQAEVRQAWSRALAGEEWTFVAPFGDPGLARPHYEIRFRTLRDAAGERIGAFQFAYDVSDRLRDQAALLDAQAQLRQSQKLEAVGQLTGGVAHDFNNFLTVIRGSVELLLRPNVPEAKQRRYIQAIADTTQRATKLTGQLLAFARRQALRPEVFEVNAAVLAVTDMIGALTGSQVVIETRTAEGPVHIDADPSQFDTALVNMAVNARDAMDASGRLTVTVGLASEIPAVRTHPAVAGDFVAVSLTDTGQGIPPDQLDQIFEPFFTTKEVGKGTGLGLSQVFGFAKQSGGEVVVESEPGRGSTFTLYLPRAPADAAVTAATAGAEPLVDGAGACVLVVEDNPDVGAFAVSALRELGYLSLLAPHAEAALTELGKDADRFQIVFSDVVMPGMDGVELGAEVRRRHPGLPVVLASGYSHVLAQSGPRGFELLHKPYSIEQLSRVLRKAARAKAESLQA